MPDPLVSARPTVSAVIATRNRTDVLPEALDSIFAQEGLGRQFDLEVVVVDDASSDNVAEVVARYSGVRYIRLPVNQGQSAARNAGIRNSSGQYVAFLDDDDLWLPQKLALQVSALEAHPQAGLVYSQLVIVVEGQRLLFPEGPAPSGSLFRRLLFVNLCGNPGVPLVRRDALEKVGGFSEDVSGVEDYDLWLRLSYSVPFIYVPGAVAVYRQAREGHMLTGLRSGKYDRTLTMVIERALARVPDTDETSTLKRQVRANRELRIAALLEDEAVAWVRLRAGIAMWPELALNPANRLSIATIIAAQAMSAASPLDTTKRLWSEINEVQRRPGRAERTAMRDLLAEAYWRAGVVYGKGIGRPADAAAAARAILRSILLRPVAPRRWRALLGFAVRTVGGVTGPDRVGATKGECGRWD